MFYSRTFVSILSLLATACLGRTVGPGADGDADGGGPSGDSADGSAGDSAGDASRGTTRGTDGGDGTATATATSGAVTTGATSDTDGDTDGAGTFECDTFTQDCIFGERCMPFGSDGSGTWDSTHCTGISPGAVGLGDQCRVEGSPTSGVDTCGLGLMCWDLDPETNEGVCIALCAGSPEDPLCPAATECLMTNDGALSVCVPTCDPRMSACPNFQLCVPTAGQFWCVPGTANPGFAGDVCTSFYDCDTGLACIDSAALSGCDGQSCCAAVCDLTAPDPNAACLGPTTCLSWFEDPDLGVCAVAP